MRGICVQLQSDISTGSSSILCISAVLLLVLAEGSANAADSVAASEWRGRSLGDTTRGARIFSKDKPLFSQQQNVPNVTPDRRGNTKVKVIVKPAEPNRQTTTVRKVKTPKSYTSRRQSPPLDAYRDDRERPIKVDVSKADSQASSSKAQQAISKPENGGNEFKYSDVLVPTGNPKRLSALGSAHREQSRANEARKVKAKSRATAGRVTQGQGKRRRTYVVRTTPNRTRRARRHQRRPYWRHFAPPGTVHSFVRCWPGEPCVRYYRVRRPKTLRQYRRLLAWQRREDARLRYRRRYGRY